MIDFRPICFILGILLTVLGVSMLLPATVDAISADIDWQVFSASAFFTSFMGIILLLAFRSSGLPQLQLREAFLLTVSCWVSISLFAALPFFFSNLNMSASDAAFEAVSGITTTGSTVLVDLDVMPKGILLWRSLLQAIGGIGIIVMAIALLPLLRVGGMQLFRTESSDRSEKVTPRTRQMTVEISAIYAGFILLCSLCYWLAGMTAFDAINHALTTVSTGGYSTSDASLGKFGETAIQWIAVVFMLLGSITFSLYVRELHGDRLALVRDPQVRWFFSILGAATIATAVWITLYQGIEPQTAIRYAAFNVVSIATTTGYASTDYYLWGGFAVVGFYFLTFMGGCTGSTAGAIKVFRFQVLYAVASQQLARLLAPHQVSIQKVQGQEVTESIALSVLTFFFLYAVTLAGIALSLAGFGLDFETAISGSATAVGNVGPGVGPIIGPAGNFSSLPDGAKWVLVLGMLLGRLEFVTILVLLTRSFWRH
jgi:trk system potassium uptake protein TrkH